MVAGLDNKATLSLSRYCSTQKDNVEQTRGSLCEYMCATGTFDGLPARVFENLDLERCRREPFRFFGTRDGHRLDWTDISSMSHGVS